MPREAGGSPLFTAEARKAPGTQNEQGWIKTRCPAHMK